MTQGILGVVSSSDHRLMRRVNRWPAPKWMQLWMICATRGGDGWLWYALGALLALFGGPDRWRALAAAGLSIGTGIGVFLATKRAAKRRRPSAFEPHCWSTLLPPDQFSFPSGHTITAFAAALSLAAFYPPLLPSLMFCAISIALSRVILGMHFLSDVVAGAGIGALLAYLFVGLLR